MKTEMSHSPITEMLTQKYKLWLIVTLAVTAVADAAATLYVFITGIGFGYAVFPLVFCVADLLYLAVTALSNQRFKHASRYFCVYAVAVVVAFVVWIFTMFTPEAHAFTLGAGIIWIVLHAVSVCATAITYIYAAKLTRGNRVFKLTVTAISTVFAVIAAVVFCVMFAKDGYFGQGMGVRPLLYVDSENGEECYVVGVADGKGDTITVPKEFDGKRVTRVDSSVFYAEGVKNVTLECDSDVKLVNAMAVPGNLSAKVYIDRDKIDDFRTNLYKAAVGDGPDDAKEYPGCFTIANSLRPSNLGADEVCITFAYDRDSYNYSDGNILPVWIGERNEGFAMREYGARCGIPFAEKIDLSSDEDLMWNYKNSGKHILVVNELSNWTVTDSRTH